MIINISIADQQYLKNAYIADNKESRERQVRYIDDKGIEWFKPLPSQFLWSLAKIRQKYDVDDTFQAHYKAGTLYLCDKEE